jgi:hypothetical protein
MSKPPSGQEVKPARKTWPERWSKVKARGKPLQLYLLLDAAQRRDLLAQMPQTGAEALFAFSRDSQEGKVSPWLVHLGLSGQALKKPQQGFLDAVLDVVQASPCATLLASEREQPVLMAHLRRAMDPRMPGKDSSYLALWDPAILAALLGQSDVDSQSRIEAVLSSAQGRALLGPVSYWWCWSRSGRLQEYAASDFSSPGRPRTETPLSEGQRPHAAGSVGCHFSAPAAPLPLSLSAAQVDALVQGSVPDLLIYYVNLNQSHLRDKLPPLAMHWFARQQLVYAHRLGLTGTRDLLNYLCVALTVGERFDQYPSLSPILARVKAGHLSFDKAMEEIAAKVDDEKQAREPRVMTDARGLPLTESQLPL